MKEVIAIGRINMMNQTKQALTDCGVDAFFAHEAQGRGKGFVNPQVLSGASQGYEEAASRLSTGGQLYPKRMITAVVPDNKVDEVVTTLIKINQTGRPGDGKIFVAPIKDAVRVRTAEAGEKAIG
jgi:nitrogen regulatory protein PII 2